MKTWFFILGPLFALLAAPAAHAQITLDVSKITCREYLAARVISTKSISIWLSGYYNAKRDNTVLQLGTIDESADKLQSYCGMHQDLAVMKAVDAVFGTSSK